MSKLFIMFRKNIMMFLVINMGIREVNEMFDNMSWEVNHIKRKAIVRLKYLYIDNKKM